MSLRHSIEYAALVALARGVRILPRRAALGVGATIAASLWTAGLRRDVVEANLAQALPGTSLERRRRIAAGAARNFGRTAVEFLRFDRDRERVRDLVRLDGVETLRDALAGGRGAIVVTGHVGAWALYAAALSLAGFPTVLLIGRQSNPKVHAFYRSLSGGRLEFVSQRKAAPRQLLRSLSENKAVVLVADQHAGGRGTLAPFFGRETFTMALPAALAARRSAPLLAMFGNRGRDGRHRVSFRELTVPAELHADREGWRRRVAIACNEAIESAALARPDQYFWFHRRYRPTDPPGPG